MIERRRGDTKIIKFKLWADKASQIPLDITGFTFKLTVDPEKAPEDSSNNLFTLVGVIIDPLQGTVKFEPTEEQMDIAPATYYYDLEVTDAAGKIDTAKLDKFKIKQDITK